MLRQIAREKKRLIGKVAQGFRGPGGQKSPIFARSAFFTSSKIALWLDNDVFKFPVSYPFGLLWNMVFAVNRYDPGVQQITVACAPIIDSVYPAGPPVDRT